MKKPLFLICFLTVFTASAQEEFTYITQVDLGFGGTLFNVPNSTNALSIPKAFGTVASLDAQFRVKGPFSVGFSFMHHTYATENAGTENTTFLEAKSNTALFIANYHLIDKKKINFCIGSGFGVNGFNYNRIDVIDSVQYTGKVKLQGSSFLMNTQLRYYFIKNLGVFLRGQFLVNGGRISSFKVNGEEKEYIDRQRVSDVTYSFRGATVQLGLSLRF